MRRLLPILATLILCGCGPEMSSMEGYKSFAYKLRLARDVEIYEGCPPNEADAQQLSPGEKPATIEFGGYGFYEKPLDLSAEDKEAVSRLFRDVTLVKPKNLSLGSCCGDYGNRVCLVWKIRSEPYFVVISFAPSEIKAVGGGNELVLDFDNESYAEVSEILGPYMKHLEKWKQQDVSTTVEPADFPDPFGEYKRYGG